MMYNSILNQIIMKEIIINGFTYYVDVINRILYEDREKKKACHLTIYQKMN